MRSWSKTFLRVPLTEDGSCRKEHRSITFFVFFFLYYTQDRMCPISKAHDERGYLVNKRNESRTEKSERVWGTEGGATTGGP